MTTSLETRAIVDRAEHLQTIGSNVFDVSPADAGASLSAANCDSLNSIVGTRTAGAVLERGMVRAGVDDEDWERLNVTAGYAALVWPDSDLKIGGDLLVGAAVAERYGLVDGARWSFSDATGSVTSAVQVMPRSPRIPEADQTVVRVLTAEGSIASCQVETDPGSSAAMISAIRSWFMPSELLVTPYPVKSGDLTPQSQLNQRMGVWLPVAASLVSIGLVLGFWKFRERDFALYSIQGTPPRRMLVMLVMESFLLMGIPLCVGFLLAAVLVHDALLRGVVLNSLLLAAGVSSAMAALVPVLGLWLLPTRTALARLRSA